MEQHFRPQLSLGRYLRKKRLEAGLTQADLGRILGYRPQFIANWEREASNPPAHILRKVVTVLRIPEEEILEFLYRQSMAYWKGIIQPAKKRRKQA